MSAFFLQVTHCRERRARVSVNTVPWPRVPAAETQASTPALEAFNKHSSMACRPERVRAKNALNQEYILQLFPLTPSISRCPPSPASLFPLLSGIHDSDTEASGCFQIRPTPQRWTKLDLQRQGLQRRKEGPPAPLPRSLESRVLSGGIWGRRPLPAHTQASPELKAMLLSMVRFKGMETGRRGWPALGALEHRTESNKPDPRLQAGGAVTCSVDMGICRVCVHGCVWVCTHECVCASRYPWDSSFQPQDLIQWVGPGHLLPLAALVKSPVLGQPSPSPTNHMPCTGLFWVTPPHHQCARAFSPT